ncbi:addiction module antidote protein [Desulfonema magnum]|uniref:Addiction module antidote protein domain-containing protein n=1 Tax=Desulfonema magnum TaxID=45655 RepID=A0A975GSC3_9BACT|nr:addiction module antidote protein [Desulfonema magnum]QTA91767.1 putative addiction module antidote protein domain-containing protein [Desulfonema magnum]
MRDYRELVTEKMYDPDEAAEYLRCSLDEYFKDGNTEAFLTAIRTVAKARGGMTKLSNQTKLNRQTLYRTLSEKGNPSINTLRSILNSLGFRLSIEPISAKHSAS